ncbi:xanthine dehydrogenase family protein molybdopterin-binding subunit [Siminovitchia fortis]|uniref:Xanthine dehydrogenase family protein molybdopterin-binding subunit n=1 Tax=Siminovitchia fortis TaxID=254758 RepID=A0A443IKH7_9BACI|nr:xanthine dehydrogenase family protein molybdopterin-binding subunit [Siminovitchia fortis]RWR05139.1 xanthine dehydrogenase family protein molybdopterin-binding subunit [Siminovitchia fortis]WHY81801.1 xanthine dehydrogenase family protein molybdopterin-binding subunit [Siminovitchia fortis]
MKIIGQSVFRKESWEKVTGKAKYTNDFEPKEMLFGKLVTSPYGHAKINHIDTSEAIKMRGVRAVITGGKFPLTGEEMRDRPPIAVDRVRYYGEVVAIVVADTLATAQLAASQIHISYAPLPVVNSPSAALQPGAPLLHENLGSYEKIAGVYPVPGTNIASKIKIRKGNIRKGWEESEVSVQSTFSFNPSDHAAMETRCSFAQIHEDGKVEITSSSQAPFMIKKLMATYFGIPTGNILVKTPLVGGAYGGKASVQLEILAYIASKAVNGRLVKVVNDREEDMVTSPGHIGLEATVKLGSTKDGILKAAELLYLWDGGAYSDKSIDLARAGAVDCTGPYRIENIYCDSLCMYTNHPYPAPFRGFSHSEVHFAFERTMDMLAKKLNMDPLDFRYNNAIKPGDTTPTQVKLTRSSVGNVQKCITRLKELIHWDDGQRIEVGENTIRAKGVSCIWKTSTIDTNASSGVILTFNPDGSINLMSGVVEIGTGTKTILAQILAERLKMPVEKIHVQMLVNTQNTPEHWKTVASRATFMAGRAVLNAADDVILQLKERAACILRAPAEDLEVGYEKVFLRDDPDIHIPVKDIAYGFVYPNGNTVGGQIIGSGTYTLRHMTRLDKETGAGKPGPEWTVGAQGVEIEIDTRTYRYRLLKAVSVIDIGRVLNQKTAEGQVMGAMNIGLSFGGRETFIFDKDARVLNPQLRTYRPIRFGEQPEYIVDFVETPQIDAPYGARGVGEHGLIGMPAALANSLSAALEVELRYLPLTPELLWRTKEGGT